MAKRGWATAVEALPRGERLPFAVLPTLLLGRVRGQSPRPPRTTGPCRSCIPAPRHAPHPPLRARPLSPAPRPPPRPRRRTAMCGVPCALGRTRLCSPVASRLRTTWAPGSTPGHVRRMSLAARSRWSLGTGAQTRWSSRRPSTWSTPPWQPLPPPPATVAPPVAPSWSALSALPPPRATARVAQVPSLHTASAWETRSAASARGSQAPRGRRRCHRALVGRAVRPIPAPGRRTPWCPRLSTRLPVAPPTSSLPPSRAARHVAFSLLSPLPPECATHPRPPPPVIPCVCPRSWPPRPRGRLASAAR